MSARKSRRRGKWTKRVPFRFYVLQEAAGAGEFDAIEDIDDIPVELLDTVMIPDNLKEGFINRIKYQINVTNAVTYTLRIWCAAIAADYASHLSLLYESPLLQADDVLYDRAELHIPFILATPGEMFYSLEPTGATGNVSGFIEVTGEAAE